MYVTDSLLSESLLADNIAEAGHNSFGQSSSHIPSASRASWSRSGNSLALLALVD